MHNDEEALLRAKIGKMLGNGLVTQTASRKASGTDVWERFTP